MKRDRLRNKILYIVICVSLFLNALFILPYIETYTFKIYHKFHPIKYVGSSMNDSCYTDLVLEKSLHMNGNLYKTSEFDGPASDIPQFFKLIKKRYGGGIFSFPLGYCYAGISYYALSKERPDLLEILKNKADKLINEEGTGVNFNLNTPDKLPFGILFINLYKLSGDEVYKTVADSIYRTTLNFRDKNDIISYLPHKNSGYIDVVGMVVPFLREYYDLTGDTLANKIAVSNILYYKRMCSDDETGLPHHGFSEKYNIKLGSSNWGRGIGWYLLAMSYYPEFIDEGLYNIIERLPKTQFPGTEGSEYDSSTDIMFEIFKKSYKPSRDIDITDIKNHTLIDGTICCCSGDTYGYNDYSHIFGGSELCNGLFLMLVSKFGSK